MERTTAGASLSRDAIKYIAMLTMFLNHVANAFLPEGTFWYEALVDVGYFTAITMCYFLVEGYAYTHSKIKYGLRLLAFAVLSQYPFMLAFSKPGNLRFSGFNMLFTLFICFLLLVVGEKISNPILRNVVRVILVCCTMAGDWPLLAAIYTWLFDWAGTSEERLKIVYPIAALLFWLMMLPVGLLLYPPLIAAAYAACGTLGIFASGFCIRHLYSGRRVKKGQNFSKWFFYLFYPVHLLAIGLVRLALSV